MKGAVMGEAWYFIMKRVLDLILSVTFIVVFMPVYLVVAFLVWFGDKHSPIYIQRRIGKDKKEFDFYKFRSMVINADEILSKDKDLYARIRSGANKIKDDPRVTKVGRFIRKYSIDEFPQVFNVIKGDMSFVGPRALRPDEFEMHRSKSEENAKRLDTLTSVKPGITGYWQVSGRSNVDFEKRIEMDCYYAQKKSIIMDLQILLKTPFVVIKGEGAY